MAEQKKSFVLYGDLIHTTQHLSNEDAGKVFKWVLEYVNDNHPEPLKGLLAAVCEPIKQQLKRDLLKYESKREQYSEAGKKSAEARRLKKLKEKELKKDSQRTLTNVESRSTNSTVTVNDTVNVSVTVNDIKEKVYSKEIHDCLDNCLTSFPNTLHPNDTQKPKWLDTIDKLNRIDKIPYEVIESITSKVRQDNFWSKNFMSLTKLRKNNKDGVKYIVAFYEQFKNKTNGKQFTDYTRSIRESNPNI